jgi:integrase
VDKLIGRYTYPRLRPKELWEIKEQDIDLGRAVILAHKTKEGKPKIVPLIDEDVELVRQMKEDFPGFPDQFFFRHPGGVNRAKAGDRYGKHYFSKWWNRACKNVGVEGVPSVSGDQAFDGYGHARGRLQPGRDQAGDRSLNE